MAQAASTESQINPEAKSTSVKRLLVLDLHGTLVLESDSGRDHGNRDDKERRAAPRSCFVRPHAREFLLQARSLGYDLAVWSASELDEINAALRTFWPFEQVGPPSFIFTHEQCTRRRKLDADGPLGIYDVGQWRVVKKLSKVWRVHKQYAKDHTLALDNLSSTFSDNFGNGILIGTYDGDADDQELFDVLEKLKHLTKAANVPTIDKRGTADSVALAVEANKARLKVLSECGL